MTLWSGWTSKSLQPRIDRRVTIEYKWISLVNYTRRRRRGVGKLSFKKKWCLSQFTLGTFDCSKKYATIDLNGYEKLLDGPSTLNTSDGFTKIHISTPGPCQTVTDCIRVMEAAFQPTKMRLSYYSTSYHTHYYCLDKEEQWLTQN